MVDLYFWLTVSVIVPSFLYPYLYPSFISRLSNINSGRFLQLYVLVIDNFTRRLYSTFTSSRSMLHKGVWLSLLLALSAQAQSCENYGTPNGSGCACPVGFGGSTCSQPACGGTIFQGSQRSLAPPIGQFSNLTASGCNCADGWTGTGCNVCTSSNACTAGLNSVSNGGDSSTVPGLSGGLSNLVCNQQARVYASSQMSCRVEVRLLLSYALNVLSSFLVTESNPSSHLPRNVNLEHHAYH